MKGSGRRLIYVPRGMDAYPLSHMNQDTYERGLFDVIQCGRHLEV